MSAQITDLLNGVAGLEIKPDGKYLLFVDSTSVDAQALMQCDPEATFEATFMLMEPPQGKSLRECVAVIDQTLQPIVDASAIPEEVLAEVAKRTTILSIREVETGTQFQNIGELIKAAVAAERERCARIAESEASQYNHPTLKHCETAVSSYRVAMYIADEIRGRE